MGGCRDQSGAASSYDFPEMTEALSTVPRKTSWQAMNRYLESGDQVIGGHFRCSERGTFGFSALLIADNSTFHRNPLPS